MRVNLYATLRSRTGRKEIEIDLPPGATVRGLLDAVLERHPEIREELVDEAGKLYGHVHLFVNGRDATYLEHGLETVLGPEDSVDLFPAVAGG